MSEKNFKSVNPGTSLRFIRAKELAEAGVTGPVLTGVFVEALKNNYDPDKKDFKFETESGETVIINGTGQLTALMSKVTPGDLVRIDYLGQDKIKSGLMKGKTAHKFDVLKAE